MSDTSLNKFVGYGTNAERLAFTPSPATIAAAPKQLYLWYATDTNKLWGYDTGWHDMSAAAGTGDVVGPAASIDSEIAIYNSTTGKLLKRASTTGLLKGTSGVLSAATDGTDYLSPATGPKKLAQIITAASQATVDFTSISGAYTSLMVRWTSQDTTAGTGLSVLRLKINNDGTAGNYTSSNRIGSENGSAFASSVASSTAGIWIGLHPNVGNTNIAGSGSCVIDGYAATTFHKSILGDGRQDSSGFADLWSVGARWASAAAITRLTFGTDGTAFTDGSIFTLYGWP